jgi:sulfur-carrier protein
MSVSVRIPAILCSFTGGSAEVAAEPATLREVIARLDAAYPPGRPDRRRDRQPAQVSQRLREGGGGGFDRGLATPVPVGAHVPVIPAVTGG